MSMRAVGSLAAVLGRADRVHFESFAHFGLDEEWIKRPDLRPRGASARVVRHVQVGRELEAGRSAPSSSGATTPPSCCPSRGACAAASRARTSSRSCTSTC